MRSKLGLIVNIYAANQDVEPASRGSPIGTVRAIQQRGDGAHGPGFYKAISDGWSLALGYDPTADVRR